MPGKVGMTSRITCWNARSRAGCRRRDGYTSEIGSGVAHQSGSSRIQMFFFAGFALLAALLFALYARGYRMQDNYRG